MELIRPPALKPGDTIGIFTPSSPAYLHNEGLFSNGLENPRKLGFRVKLGNLTERRENQGYRSGTAQQRAQEFMDLILDPEVRCLMSTIGGYNSNSMIPFLDFAAIRANPKIICGYSDVTSLHLSILAYSGVSTFYGPAVMCWFGDYPNGVSESTESFLAATTQTAGTRELVAFPRWSNHKRRWDNGDWKNLPREWVSNPGWLALNRGSATGPIVAANLSTVMSAAGTSYFPDVTKKILLLESMAAPFHSEERCLRQLQLMGVFDRIEGLIIGKPEVPDSLGAPFTHEELILEVVGRSRPYPIITQFDCSHTLPMHTIAQHTRVRLEARSGYESRVTLLEPMVS